MSSCLAFSISSCLFLAHSIDWLPWKLLSKRTLLFQQMASQALAENISCYKIHSYIRGYHVYKDNWIPVIGQVLLLKREPENAHDRNAVSVTTSCGEVLGHVP